MMFSSDIAGACCSAIEEEVGGVALFINADAGDIDPTDEVCGCNGGVCAFPGRTAFASAVATVRAKLEPVTSITISTYSEIVPFGETSLNITLARFNNCTSGGPLDLCSLCYMIGCDANIHLPESWVEENPRFTAMNINVNGVNTGIVTVPGEPLIELGWWIRNDTQALKFDQTLLFGYSNNHMGYFATPNEYDWGGYESQLTFWGIGTANEIRQACKSVAQRVSPFRLRDEHSP